MANIINKGIRARITIAGGNFILGKEYTCTLYHGVKFPDGRATVTAIAQEITNADGVTKTACVFVFEPEDTAKLKAGTVILEVYDNGSLEQMSFVENFATIRANSVSS